jgi:hypothetical protein
MSGNEDMIIVGTVVVALLIGVGLFLKCRQNREQEGKEKD